MLTPSVSEPSLKPKLKSIGKTPRSPSSEVTSLLPCLYFPIDLLLGLISSRLSPASVPVADALQGRIAELTAELEGQKKETARLQGVETELSKTIRDLRAESTSM